jgi:hypothetical protein
VHREAEGAGPEMGGHRLRGPILEGQLHHLQPVHGGERGEAQTRQ